MDPAYLTAQAVELVAQLLLEQHRLGGPPGGRPPSADHRREVELIRAIQAKLDDVVTRYAIIEAEIAAEERKEQERAAFGLKGYPPG